MAVIAVDVLIKTMIEAAFADLRKNSWILEDVFSGLATDTLANTEYGFKEVEAAKKWFLNNNIEVYLNNRIDNPRFPCITVVHTSSREMTERASTSDEGFIEDYNPEDITAQVQKVYKNFTPSKYDHKTGYVTMPLGLTTSDVIPGQFLVSQRSGKAYVIIKNLDDETFVINKNIKDDFTDCFISPPTALWNIHRELTFFDESFAVGMHTQSDVNQAIWLRQLMAYIFLRYKEAYLERRGYEISTFSIGSIEVNPHFEAEKVFSCPLNLNGQVQVDWIKFAAPKLQGTAGGIYIIDGPRTPEEYRKYAKKQGWQMIEDKEE